MKTFITTRCRESLGGQGSVPMVKAFTRKSIGPKKSGSRTWTNNNVLRFHMLIYIDLYWFKVIYMIDLYVGSLQYFSISESFVHHFFARGRRFFFVQIHVHKQFSTLYIHSIKLILDYILFTVMRKIISQPYKYIHIFIVVMTWQHIHVPKKSTICAVLCNFYDSMIKNVHEKYGHSDWNLEEFSATPVKITTSEKHTPHLKPFLTIFQPFLQPVSTLFHPYSTLFNHISTLFQPYSTFKKPHLFLGPCSFDATRRAAKEPLQEAPNASDQLWSSHRHLRWIPSIRTFHSSPRMVIPTNPMADIGIMYSRDL